MVDNVPYRSLEFNGLTIEGYSRAAVQSYWRIPELKLGFDFGAQPWDFMGTGTWFVSHTHLDHIAAIAVYIARRRMMKMDPPTIYLPEECVDGVQQVLRAFSRLDRGRLPCSLKPLKAGDEIELSRELLVTAVATDHSVPSLGYIVWERRKKLKPEYQDLTGEQIRDIRLGGTEVSEETRLPRLGYLGDSTPRGLDNNPEFYNTEVLITELTFVAPDHRPEMIRKLGHIHLDHLVERQQLFNNKLIIAGHLSTRYHPKQVERIVRKALPDMLDGRLHLWL